MCNEIAADITQLLSQLIKFLSKVISCNVLDYYNDNAIEPYVLLHHVTFLDDLNEMFNYAERNDIASV